MPDPENEISTTQTAAKKIFSTAPTEYKEIIRDTLREEREVMHLRRRADIHQNIYDIVRRIIK